jgi:putative hydrolase of the HAD superfamily
MNRFAGQLPANEAGIFCGDRSNTKPREKCGLTIFLDLDGTLLDHDFAERSAAVAFLRAFRVHFPGWSANDFADRWQTIAQKHLSAYLVGQLSFTGQRRERLREIFGLVDISLSDRIADEFFEVYLRCYERSWQLFPDAVPTLDRLEDHTLGIISNGDRIQQFHKLESLGVKERFAHIVISAEVGVAKPDAAIFHEAWRRADCPPHMSVYVGDRLETDAMGSRQAGLHGIWLDRSGIGPRPSDVATISSLDELPGFVERMEETWANHP